MVTYTTKFSVNQTFDKNEFVKMVIKWNQGSKFDKIENLYWDEKKYECEWTQENVTLKFQEIERESIIASRLIKEDEHGVWFTDFVLNEENCSLAISVSLETTEFTTDFFPTYYPPFFVKMVLFAKYSGSDNGLEVRNYEHDVNECMAFYKGVIAKTILPELPVVFVARTNKGSNPLDVNKLAFRLQGVAHVICESEEGTILSGFTDVLDSCEDRAGKIFIEYPSRNKKSRILNITGSSRDSDYLEDRVVNDVYNYMNARMRKAIDTWDGVTTEKLHIINRDLLSDQIEIQEENRNLYDVFGLHLEKMEESNIKLSNDVQRLTAELQGLRMKYSDKNQTPVLYLGEERNLYAGEIKEIILEIMSEYQKNCKQGSRRSHIISDLIESNEFKGIPEKRREQLKRALKGYKTLNGSMKSLLETFGFEISDDGKHYKWTYYGDQRYVVTAAKTASDGRAGMNLSSIIDKLIN
ncbi:MAG: hypothetical protein Q4G58_04945 [bacterium]|nr:hypothetical protein [bacterium]